MTHQFAKLLVATFLRPRLIWLIAASVYLIVASGPHHAASAHEGHKALPTKGARVDGDTVYLSAAAHQALGLTTAEVDLRRLSNTVTATASVVAPWKQRAFVSTRLKGRLERILCRPGDLVEVGQKLAEIESLGVRPRGFCPYGRNWTTSGRMSEGPRPSANRRPRGLGSNTTCSLA